MQQNYSHQGPPQMGDYNETMRYLFREASNAARNAQSNQIVMKLQAANQRLVQIGADETVRNTIVEQLMKTMDSYGPSGSDMQMQQDPYSSSEQYQMEQYSGGQMGGRPHGYGHPPLPPDIMSHEEQSVRQHSAFSNPSTPSLGRLNLCSPSNVRGYEESQRSIDNYSEPSSMQHYNDRDRRSANSYPAFIDMQPEGNSRSSLTEMPLSEPCVDPVSNNSYDSAGSDRHMGIQVAGKMTNSREKKPQKNVQQLQGLYVRYHGRQRAEQAMHWSSSSSRRQNDTQVPSGEPIAMSMAIVNAPASMSLPCKPNKLFHPPFKVRVYVGYHNELCFKCSVRAYVLCEQQVDNIGIWVPETHGLGESFDKGIEEYSFELTEDEVQRQKSRHPNEEQRMMHHDFEFTDMRFQSPSRMKKRWVVFVVQAPNKDLLLCVYKVPTVVVSRSIDQYNKALLILQGIVPKDGRSMRGKIRDSRMLNGEEKLSGGFIGDKVTKKAFAQYIINTYSAQGLGDRPLSDDDLSGLCTIAGFTTSTATKPAQSMNAFDAMETDSADPEILSADNWSAFECWWEACLKMLRNVKHLWIQISPIIVCPFSVDRDQATSMLVDKPPETFLIRISTTRPGCFVISRRLKEGTSGRDQVDWVKHAVLHSQDVHDRAMETWIRDMQGVNQLLDVNAMQLVDKQDIFHTGYKRWQETNAGNQPNTEHPVYKLVIENDGYNIHLPEQRISQGDEVGHMDMALQT